MPQVNGEDHLARDHVDLIGLDRELADGRDGGLSEGFRDRLDCLYHRGRPGKRVDPQVHRGRPGMVGASGHRHLEVRGAYDGAHDGEWRS